MLYYMEKNENQAIMEFASLNKPTSITTNQGWSNSAFKYNSFFLIKIEKESLIQKL